MPHAATTPARLKADPRVRHRGRPRPHAAVDAQNTGHKRRPLTRDQGSAGCPSSARLGRPRPLPTHPQRISCARRDPPGRRDSPPPSSASKCRVRPPAIPPSAVPFAARPLLISQAFPPQPLRLVWLPHHLPSAPCPCPCLIEPSRSRHRTRPPRSVPACREDRPPPHSRVNRPCPRTRSQSRSSPYQVAARLRLAAAPLTRTNDSRFR